VWKRFYRMRCPSLVAAALVAGCAATSGVRENDDGTLSVQCSGGYHDWTRCHQRATRACGDRAFDIVSRVSDEGSSSVGSRDWSRDGSEVSRTLVVRCS
jgi:hypothetical protein